MMSLDAAKVTTKRDVMSSVRQPVSETMKRGDAGEVRLAVVGAGLIGRRHVEHVARQAQLLAIVDPAPGTRELAERFDTRWFPTLRALLSEVRPDGVIIATPNQLHVDNGLECVAAGIPVLVEKPLAADVASAERLAEAAEAAKVPILVGHHRRHNPLIRKAKEAIDSGSLGAVLAVHATCWFHKPDDYFDAAWRREPGAGPVFINLTHDIDSLRHLCGEVASVQAIESSMARGNPVEDTAAILLRFRSGAIGTISVSDAIASPWSWELTSGENPAYPQAGEACYLIGGTHGSLSLPSLDRWSYEGERSWWKPISRTRLAHEDEDPLVLQLRHFCDVVRGRAEPLVSARDGLETLRVVAAVKQAARGGRMVRLDQPQAARKQSDQ